MKPFKPIATFTRANEPAGPMCRLDAKPMGSGKSALVNTGAVSSAFMGFLV